MPESPLFLQSIIDSIPLPIFYKDARCVYLGCNEAFARMLGLPKKEIIGKTVRDIAPSDLADVYERADLALLESGGSQFYETKVQFADGRPHDVVFYKVVFDVGDAGGAGIVGTLLDVTTRKAAERRYVHEATHDHLTGVANRRQMQRYLAEAHTAFIDGRHPCAILLLDLDYFKLVNDIHGHPTGDEVLKTVTALLRQATRAHQPDRSLGRRGVPVFDSWGLGRSCPRSRRASGRRGDR